MDVADRCSRILAEVERAIVGKREALELAAMAGDDQRVLVVGHNPDFEQVIYDLTGGRVELKTALAPDTPVLAAKFDNLKDGAPAIVKAPVPAPAPASAPAPTSGRMQAGA